MINTFNFKYFTPTPDTTANCALSRWNDSLIDLSDFIKSYMSNRQSLEFGLSRTLNVKELLNLTRGDSRISNKYSYLIDYNKYGDIKANICGFTIPIIDYNHPFLISKIKETYPISTLDFLFNNDIIHVFNKNSSYSKQERIDATITALNAFKTDVQNVDLMSDSHLVKCFKKHTDGTTRTRNDIVTTIEYVISIIENTLTQSEKDFIFGFNNKDDFKNIDSDLNVTYPYYAGYGTYTDQLYQDLCYNSCIGDVYNNSLNIFISDDYKKDFQEKYLTPNGIEFIYLQKTNYEYYNDTDYPNHLLLFFEFTMIEKPCLTPFVSHDGSYVPISEQSIEIKYFINNSSNDEFSWNDEEECPMYNSTNMVVDSNINGMIGKDYTIWTTPAILVENGFKFICCIPLAFYNEELESYGNEYYAKYDHEDIRVGQVLYRVPVVKRMLQNVEEAIVNTHLSKCINQTTPANDSNFEDDNTVILGGVVVDDFTKGLYPVEDFNIATENEYGDVKIIKLNKDDDNVVDDSRLDLMSHYSSTGELTYYDETMPEDGRCIDLITLYDVLKHLHYDKPITSGNPFVNNGLNSEVQISTEEGGFIVASKYDITLITKYDNPGAASHFNVYSDKVYIDGEEDKIVLCSGSEIDDSGTVDHTISNEVADLTVYSDINNHEALIMFELRYKDENNDYTTSSVLLNNQTYDDGVVRAALYPEEGACAIGKKYNPWDVGYFNRIYETYPSILRNDIGGLFYYKVTFKNNGVSTDYLALSRENEIKINKILSTNIKVIAINGSVVDANTYKVLVAISSVTFSADDTKDIDIWLVRTA